MVTVRSATPADATALATLRYEFRSGVHPPTEPRETFIDRCTAWMAERLAASGEGRWQCFVAQRGGGTTVGHVWVQLVEKIPNPTEEAERHAYLTNLFVRPEARGGAGSALLETALAWCREREVDTVFLWPSARSRSLYERFGVTGNGAIMAMAPGRA